MAALTPNALLEDPDFQKWLKEDRPAAQTYFEKKTGKPFGPDTSRMTQEETKFRAGAKEVDKMPDTQRLLTGLGELVVSTGRGIAAPFVSPEKRKQWKSETAYNEPLNRTFAGSSGVAFGKALEMMLLPSTRKLSFIPRVAAESAMQGGLEALRLPDPGESRTLNAALGAGGGVMAEGLSSLGAKTVNTLLDRPADAVTRELVDTAKPNKIPVTVADLPGHRMARRAQSATSHIPLLGSGGTAVKQSERSAKMVEEFVDSLYPTGMTKDTPELDKQAFLADAFKSKYKAAKGAASAEYSSLPSLDITTPVDLPISGQKALDIKNEFPTILDDPDIPASTRVIIGKLADAGQTSHMAPDVINADRAIGKLIRQEKSKLSRSGGSEDKLRMLMELRGALKQDTYSWAKNTGQTAFMDALKAADQNFAKTVVPFRNNPVTRKILYDDVFNLDKLFSAVTRKNAPGLASKMTDLMTPQGTQLRQAEALKDIFEASFDKGGLKEVFQPERFVNLLESKLGSTTETLFTPTQKKQLIGMTNLLKAVGPSGEAAKVSRPGFSSQLAGGLTGGALSTAVGYGLMTNPKTTLSAIGGTGAVLGFTKLFTTDTGRRLLTSASTLKPGSPELSRLLVQADKLIKGYVAKEAQIYAQRKKDTVK